MRRIGICCCAVVLLACGQGKDNPAMDQAAQPATDSATMAPAPAAPAAEDPMDKLRELAQLNKEGILTDEEFAAAKAKILGI